MNRLLRWIFFVFFVRPVILIIIGLNVRNRQGLPAKGPAVIVANHNSHLDTMVLISLLPIRLLQRIRPVAAADYFLRTPLLTWFALKIVGVIPILRQAHGSSHPLEGAFHALDEGEILILFPEGSRGEPEHMQALKRGIGHLAKKYPHVPVVPVFMHGLGKALPKGDPLLVPFFCDVYVGKEMHGVEDIKEFMGHLNAQFDELRSVAGPQPWS